MEFCAKCGGLVVLKEGRPICAGCGSKSMKKPKIKAVERIGRKGEVAVVKLSGDEIYPIVDMKCPKCNNKECYFWTMQTRAADESETKFYKCVKCKHTWRVYR